ncbi:MAG: hypothetical protein A2583_13380 [Bdellovibrionales bacterium RIFOXYD1_FULL_53_11]|nr:MAG: hypothetical protein A2583_13380 [Bdellovibrionales bacterium RIFOXYD1_FULL_53_11]
MMVSVMFAGITAQTVAAQTGTYSSVYTNTNLSDWAGAVSIEPNPGAGTTCDFLQSDVGATAQAEYLEVVSNVNQRNVWVNAIAGKSFYENLPDGQAIALGTYKYSLKFRIPVIPATDLGQVQNGGSTCSLIQLWDGRGAIKPNDGLTHEFAYFWVLNAWDASYGRFFVFTGYPLAIHDTGIFLSPDTQWHTMEMVVNFSTRKYVSLKIDGMAADISGVEMGKVNHADWSADTRVAMTITAESLSTWPGATCTSVFTWTTHYKDVVFSRYSDAVAADDNDEDSLLNRRCFIATAVYGDQDHFLVKRLRVFRDGFLKKSAGGRALIAYYYEKSPRFAAIVSERAYLRYPLAAVLTPLILCVAYPAGAGCMFLLVLTGGIVVRTRRLKKSG